MSDHNDGILRVMELKTAAQRAFALLVNGPKDCDDDPDDVVRALGEALGVEPGDSGFKHWATGSYDFLGKPGKPLAEVLEPEPGDQEVIETIRQIGEALDPDLEDDEVLDRIRKIAGMGGINDQPVEESQ